MMHGLEFTSQILELHSATIIVLILNYADFEISKFTYLKINCVYLAQKLSTPRYCVLYYVLTVKYYIANSNK